jgi:hypothetical protein
MTEKPKREKSTWQKRRDEIVPLLKEMVHQTKLGSLEWTPRAFIPPHETRSFKALTLKTPLGDFVFSEIEPGTYRLWVVNDGYCLWTSTYLAGCTILSPDAVATRSVYQAALTYVFDIDARIELTAREFLCLGEPQ